MIQDPLESSRFCVNTHDIFPNTEGESDIIVSIDNNLKDENIKNITIIIIKNK